MRPEHQVTVFFLPVAAAPEKGILLYPAVDGSVQMAEAIGELQPEFRPEVGLHPGESLAGGVFLPIVTLHEEGEAGGAEEGEVRLAPKEEAVREAGSPATAPKGGVDPLGRGEGVLTVQRLLGETRRLRPGAAGANQGDDADAQEQTQNFHDASSEKG